MKSATTLKSSEASRPEERSQTREKKNEIVEITEKYVVLKHPNQEHSFKIDLEDLNNVLNACTWRVEVDSKRGTYVRGKFEGKKHSLHQFLTGMTGKPIDHLNRDTLDNRKANLQFTSSARNRANSRDLDFHKDKPVGIYFHKGKKIYRAQVQFEGKNKEICSSKNILVAMIKYDEFMLKNNLPFVNLNCDLKKYSLEDCLNLFGAEFSNLFENVFNRVS